jgi:hypothetical protein
LIDIMPDPFRTLTDRTPNDVYWSTLAGTRDAVANHLKPVGDCLIDLDHLFMHI